MEGIKFNRFKKKSLQLLHEVLDDIILLKKIKNRKILETIQTMHFKQGIVEEYTFNEIHSNVLFLNENTLASGSYDTTIKIWDIITGNCLKTLEGHSNSVNFLVKINENTLASGSYDTSIKIWDIITGNCLKTLKSSDDICYLIKMNEYQIVGS